MATVASAALLVGLVSACDLAPALVLTVTSTADAHDAVPGDGVCEVTAGAGDCTLRAAIDEANASSASAFSSVQIFLGSATYSVTLPGTDDTNVGGDLDVTSAVGVAVVGNGQSIVSESAGSGVFDVVSGSLNVLRVGVEDSSGTGVHVHSGATALAGFSSFFVTDSVAGSPRGIAIDAAGTAQAVDSTFTYTRGTAIDDRAGGSFGGSFVTVSLGNNSGFAQGVIGSPAGGSTTFESSAIESCDGSTNLSIQSLGYNASTSPSCDFTQPTDLRNVPFPVVDPATSGPDALPVHPPTAGSPLLDAIPVGAGGCTSGSVDQLLVSRPVGTRCDIGAVEAVPEHLTVDVAADLPDAVPGDGACDTGSGSCSLRAAIDEANHSAGLVFIAIAAGIDPTLTRAGAGEDANATGDLDITRPVSIDGNGATIDGGGLDRVIDHRAGRLVLHDVTVTGGVADSGLGGGVRSAGSLTLRSVAISGNSALAGGGLDLEMGEGQTFGSSELDDVDVTGNQASQAGGVLIFDHLQLRGLDKVVWHGGHVSGNTATAGPGSRTAGAIEVESELEQADVLLADHLTIDANESGSVGAVNGATGGARLTASTVSHNQGPVGTFYAQDGNVTVIESTVVDNTGPLFDFGTLGNQVSFTSSTIAGNVGSVAGHGFPMRASGSIVSSPPGSSVCPDLGVPNLAHILGSFNVIDDPTCVGNVPNDVDPQLGALGPSGGPTLTRVPVFLSPAVDAIPAGTAGLCDSSTPEDQRGVTRPQGLACDIGAVEVTQAS